MSITQIDTSRPIIIQLQFILKYLSLQTTFEQAFKYINELPPTPQAGVPKITHQDKLILYGLFKQATEGDNKTTAPSMLEVVEKQKWEAWKKNEKMSKQEAMKQYVQKLYKINPKWNLKAKL